MRKKDNNFNITNIFYFFIIILYMISMFVLPKITLKFFNNLNGRIFKNFSIRQLIIIQNLYYYYPIIIVFFLNLLFIKIKNKNSTYFSIKQILKKLILFIKYFLIQIILIVSIFYILKLLKIINIKLMTYSKNVTNIILSSFLWFFIFKILPSVFYEEIIFRKIAFDFLKNRFSLIFTILTTTIIFITMHPQFYNFFTYNAKNEINIYYKLSNSIVFFIFGFIYGVLLSLIKLNTNTICSCAGLHSGYNLFNYLINPIFYTKTYSDSTFLLLPLITIKPNFHYPDFIYIFKFQIELYEFYIIILVSTSIILFIFYLVYTVLIMKKWNNIQKK